MSSQLRFLGAFSALVLACLVLTGCGSGLSGGTTGSSARASSAQKPASSTAQSATTSAGQPASTPQNFRDGYVAVRKATEPVSLAIASAFATASHYDQPKLTYEFGELSVHLKHALAPLAGLHPPASLRAPFARLVAGGQQEVTSLDHIAVQIAKGNKNAMVADVNQLHHASDQDRSASRQIDRALHLAPLK